jgi:hypothetical protein
LIGTNQTVHVQIDTFFDLLLPGVVYRSFNKEKKKYSLSSSPDDALLHERQGGGVGSAGRMEVPVMRILAEVCDEFLLLNAADSSGQLPGRNASERGCSQGHMLSFTVFWLCLLEPHPRLAST